MEKIILQLSIGSEKKTLPSWQGSFTVEHDSFKVTSKDLLKAVFNTVLKATFATTLS